MCPGADTLAVYIDGRATVAERAEIEAHAADCEDCRHTLSALARARSVDGDAPTLAAQSPGSATPGVDELAPGDPVARYIVQARLGAGGMGVVYAAHDPELGRAVALKLLAPGHGSSEARAQLEERLRREARALAQLAHPNVVAIHDVGRLGDRLFIAMELVEGQTLAAWCRAASRSPGEILEHFTAAGRGLAAAH